jgi:hypothetical protein
MGCPEPPPVSSSPPPPPAVGAPPTGLDLSTAAMRTHKRYRDAVDAGKLAPTAPIPQAMWDPAIEALRPIRVYTHRLNPVIVLNESGGGEEGIYLTNPISSYAPVDKDDGFEFTHEDDGLIHYRR